MDRELLKDKLFEKTNCDIQHDGWPCGTCFLASNDLFSNQDWQSLLLFRGDYKKEELDNLPDDPDLRIERIYSLL